MFQMAYIFAKMAEGELPDIYLQDHNYFKKYSKELKEFYGTGIIKSDCISLHIRRGDYVNNPVYVDLTQTDYYDKAIAEFPDEKFLVFCADRQEGSNDTKDKVWAMNFLENKFGNRFELYIGKDEIEDFNAMAGCKSNILANSSFSWWAGFVNPNPDKKVIAPLQWFTDGIGRVTLLEEWIKL
jgi:hypothetical protein